MYRALARMAEAAESVDAGARIVAAEGGQMMRNLMLSMSEDWFRFLQRLYPPDFRDEMGNAGVEAYIDRARQTLKNGGKIHLVALWFARGPTRLRNGAAERIRPAASWRRTGNWVMRSNWSDGG